MNNKILELLQNINPTYSYGVSTDFIGDGLIDSFDIINLVVAIDEVFNISIPGTEITPENFTNIDSIAKLLEKLSYARDV
jgi:acyl carrier protein